MLYPELLMFDIAGMILLLPQFQLEQGLPCILRFLMWWSY